LKITIKRLIFIVVSSSKVKNELMHLTSANIISIPFGIPFDFQTVTPQKRLPFFLFVGMNHGIKNVQFLIDRFLEFIHIKGFEKYELYLCGPFQDYSTLSPQIKIYPEITRIKLKHLYQTATAYLTTSYYESFNFPALEALSQNCPVVGLQTAIIPEMNDFVLKAYNYSSFLEYMKFVASGKIEGVNRKKLSSVFSWKKYVKTLNTVYNKVL
jgi:glycosyltransferase involved in cell wall biosynthesis